MCQNYLFLDVTQRLANITNVPSLRSQYFLSVLDYFEYYIQQQREILEIRSFLDCIHLPGQELVTGGQN